jgi:acetoin utilization protein AcuB
MRPTRDTTRRMAAPLHTPLDMRTKLSARTAIRDLMTEAPHSIGHDQSMALAHERMRELGVRHLPVLHAGRIVGVVSQRDLYLVETLDRFDPKTVRVEEAMAQDVYQVTPGTLASEVAGVMAERKLGCAVVVEHGKVVGLFTTTDACRALAAALAAGDA